MLKPLDVRLACHDPHLQQPHAKQKDNKPGELPYRSTMHVPVQIKTFYDQIELAAAVFIDSMVCCKWVNRIWKYVKM